MANDPIVTKLGNVSAYLDAVAHGFTGTRAEFGELLANSANYAEAAARSAEESETEALESEGYALGKQDGTDVGSGSPYYHSNAKYFSDQAGVSATGAAISKTGADASALVAEGYARGEQNGSASGPGSPYYHANAKYYSEQAGDLATGAAASATSAASSATSAASSASAAQAVKDSIPQDYTELSSDVTQLKADLGDVNNALIDITGVVPLEGYEIGSVSVSGGMLSYTNLTNKIRTKQGTLNYLKQGDTISMSTSGIYKYFYVYSADGNTNWTGIPYQLDTTVKEAPITGYYAFVIGKQDNSTIAQSEIDGIASKLNVARETTSGISAVMTEAGDTWEV